MPLTGSQSDKFGNRYEGRWTVYCLSRILSEEVISIQLEPVGAEGDGVEFTLMPANGNKEYHQVKRQHGGLGPWSLANLKTVGVLPNFWNKLQAGDSSC